MTDTGGNLHITTAPVQPLSRLEYAAEILHTRVTLLRVWSAYCAISLVHWLTAILPLLLSSFEFLKTAITRLEILPTLVHPLALLIGIAALRAPKRQQKLNWLRASTGLLTAAILAETAISLWARHTPAPILAIDRITMLTKMFRFAADLTRRLAGDLQAVVFPVAIYLVATSEVRNRSGGTGVIPVL